MARKVKYDDTDAPEITPEFFAKMRPMKDVAPELVEAHKALRGRPRLENPKAVVSVRLSAPAKQAWDTLPTKTRARIVTAMEKAAIRAAGQ
jgi:uncharacterized protein (DUF4415 family)